MKKIAALILSLTMVFFTLTALSSCSAGDDDACSYLETRDLTGRDIKYVEICVADYGKMVVLLDATTAPKTVENFISLANSGFYDGLTFHRIIDGFMIQGGDPDADGSGGSENEIFGEFASNGHANDIKHLRGVISMARSGEPNSASSQFFICHDDAAHLDGAAVHVEAKSGSAFRIGRKCSCAGLRGFFRRRRFFPRSGPPCP